MKTIAKKARNTEYNPAKGDVVRMELRNPKATASVYSSGIMIWAGSKTEENSRLAAKKFAKTIKNLGFDVKFTNFKMINIFATADIGFEVKLERFSRKYSNLWDYDPEFFNSLIYRDERFDVTFTVYASGRIVLLHLYI